MKILHLLASGNRGGIEILMKNYAMNSKLNNSFLFIWDGGPVADEMEQMGFHTIVLDKQNHGKFRIIKEILRICIDEKIDIVVSHHSAPIFKIVLMCIKVMNLNIGTVAFAHANAKDIYWEKCKKNLYLRKVIHRYGFNMADGIVAISESVKDSLKLYLHIKKNIDVIYNGTPIYNIERKINSKCNIISIIYIGRLIKEKGVQTTIKALVKIKDKIPFIFYIIGDGEYREELELLTKNHNLENNIFFLGSCDKVVHLLNSCDIFIHMPEWEEGFGITIIEAMAAGCICVCSANGAIPEIITDKGNGFLVKKGSEEDLSQKILEIYDKRNSDDIRKISEAAIKRAENFSIDSFSEKLDNYMKYIHEKINCIHHTKGCL